MREGRVPERWLVVRVARPEDPELAALAVESLLGLAVRGVEEREEDLVVYLPPPGEGDPARLLDAVSARMHEILGAPPRIEHEWRDHEDWEELWRRGLGPRRIGARILVSPSWADPEPEPGRILLTIDPGMAFGTADHATTRGCLRLLEDLVEPGDRVADAGAGSGILSIAAARLGASEVLALEMDPWSCEVMHENAELNGVADRIRIRRERVGPDFLPEEPPFDGITANIESGVLLPLLPGFRGGLRPGGWIVLSGILEDEAPEIEAAAEDAGFRLTREDREDGWWTAAFLSRARRPEVIRSRSSAPGAAGGASGPDAPRA